MVALLGIKFGSLFYATIGCGAEVEALEGSKPQKKHGVQAPPVRMDSQAKYGALARGDGAIYLRIPHRGYIETVWDNAAGSIVVIEAGGMVKDASGNDLDFSKGRHLDLDRGIIATNKHLMSLVLKAVQEVIKEEH
ncbi:3'(2'),5'-bisphosphate nucleotidase-like [Phragmites australis]|uniref:3'(2'),5'-bisphosphate nucleotidase-like n=1 Tax=Phragmites australis TaxID=29695 RepID=UPI002D764E37|nr:3'(2'),5'-bisphosphate nucleotidase-like [Phragmites australis]